MSNGWATNAGMSVTFTPRDTQHMHRCLTVDPACITMLLMFPLLTSIHMHHGYQQQRHGRHLAPKTTQGGETQHPPHPPPESYDWTVCRQLQWPSKKRLDESEQAAAYCGCTRTHPPDWFRADRFGRWRSSSVWVENSTLISIFEKKAIEAFFSLILMQIMWIYGLNDVLERFLIKKQQINSLIGVVSSRNIIKWTQKPPQMSKILTKWSDFCTQNQPFWCTSGWCIPLNLQGFWIKNLQNK